MAKKKTSKSAKSVKTAKKPALSAALFKTTGANAKIKVDDKKKKIFYFSEKVTTERAKELALKEGADLLDASPKDVEVVTPSLKYDFFCIYDATLEMKFVRVRQQEIGVNKEVAGVSIGKTVMSPKKGKDSPGNAVSLDLTELFVIKRNDSMVLDGTTGSPAKGAETLLKGPGKKAASSAWVGKASVSAGKFNDIGKIVKEVSRVASAVPKDAKRVVEHNLSFTQLDGFYVPHYYVKVSRGQKSRIMRINAVNGNVALKV